MASRQLIVRTGEVDDPLGVALGFFERYSGADVVDASRPMSFDEQDLRAANRGGARIAAVEIAAVLERRSEIESALRTIHPETSLLGPSAAIPWMPLTRLFDAFAGIRGVGFSKMTKALHPKRPALIPMLDSVVQEYLGDDPGPRSSLSFGERATALVRSYKRDLDRNSAALRALRRELAHRGYPVTEVRLLDVVIWSISAENAM
jgi:hypothetical protein